MKTTNELEKLPDDELRVMLAKIVGWKHVNVYEWKDGIRTPMQWADFDVLPNYPNDLNATAAVKATLTKRQKEVFIDILDGATMAETHPTKYIGYIELPPEDIFDQFNNASARNETIALILTLEKP